MGKPSSVAVPLNNTVLLGKKIVWFVPALTTGAVLATLFHLTNVWLETAVMPVIGACAWTISVPGVKL